MATLPGDSAGGESPFRWEPTQSELDALLHVARTATYRLLGEQVRHLADDVAAATCLLLVTGDRGLRTDLERRCWLARVAPRVALAMLVDPDERLVPLISDLSEDCRIDPEATARRNARRRERLQRLLPRLEVELTPFLRDVLHGILELRRIKELARILGVDPKRVRRAVVAIARHARRLLGLRCPPPPSCQ